MSIKKFTEGPWADSKHADSAGRLGVGQVNNTFDIAKVFGQENARLIAAAPDLVDAMNYAINRLKTAQSYGADMQSSKDLCIRDAMALLEIAMRKATQQD